MLGNLARKWTVGPSSNTMRKYEGGGPIVLLVVVVTREYEKSGLDSLCLSLDDGKMVLTGVRPHLVSPRDAHPTCRSRCRRLAG